jgi:hypothetical protein
MTTPSKLAEDLPHRWRRNISRLYARRILEIAAASAATRRFIAELEEHKKPTAWISWERKDWTDELLASLGRNKVERVYAAISRLVTLALIAAPLVILWPVSLFVDSAKQWSWNYALWGLEEAGPTFVKLTQWATTRPDLFSPEFCDHFGKLRDDTVGHTWAETKKILEEDLGELASYIQLENEPIGSGCIAQVYKGRLLKASGQYPEGSEVALKIQHPNIWNVRTTYYYIRYGSTHSTYRT